MLDDAPNKGTASPTDDLATLEALMDELGHKTVEVPPLQITNNGSEAMIAGYSPPLDAGTRAASRIRTKAAAVADTAVRAVSWLVGLSIALAIIVIVGTGYYGWENRVTGRLSDDRQCKAEYKDLTITGKRTYSYPYTEIFGFRFIDTAAIDERTVVDIRGDAMMILGQSGDEWWSLSIGMAEQGIQILKPADYFTFVVGKKAVVVKSKLFCE
jgi:hypothetical protein